MTWYEVEDFVFSTDLNNYKGIKCPECGHELTIEKDKTENKGQVGAKITCRGCGIMNIYN